MGPKKPKKKTAPTTKQRRYVKGRIEGKSKGSAARDAGYSKHTARKPAEAIESKPAVQELFKAALDRAGISDDLLAQRMREGLDAMETKFFQPRSMWRLQGTAGNVPVATEAPSDGEELIRRDLIAFSERRAMIDLIIRTKGLGAAEKHEVKLTLEDLLQETHE